MIAFEKFLVLKSVQLFKDTPDDILTQVVSAVQEMRVPAGYTIVHKGEQGTAMYIIVEGKTKVHDGDTVFVEMNSRQVFGELAALSPEMRIASVTAIEDTFLFKLEHDALYDLMSLHVGLSKGIIEFLCGRVRQIASQKNKIICR